jgi:two-component system NtrC family sensor kinase
VATTSPASATAPGIRTQILIGLVLVTLVAVLSTGYLALWAGGTSLRLQRESTAVALATAAAASAAALLDGDRPVEDGANRARLEAVGRELGRDGEISQIAFLGADRKDLVVRPPRRPGDLDPPLLLAVLGGVPPLFHYRHALEGEGVEILSYAPIKARNQVVGAVRVSLPAPAPTTVVLRRSGWVLLTLALADALLVLGLGYLVLTRLVVRPLQTVQKATALVAAGDWEQAIEPTGSREVSALAAAFNQMTASLVSQREQLIRTEKLASVGALAAGVAHEIGNPLAAILGFVDILRTSVDQPAGAGTPAAGALRPSDMKDMLDRVKAETQRIHRTIEDLLAYSRPSREEAAPTDALKILKASQGLLEPQKRFRGIRVITESPEGWSRVVVSPGRLQQVFVNLLLNAADAMEGEGTVTASCAASDGRVRISFADTGPGVPAELRRKIFDPFFTTKPPGQGTGLGLAISRSILETFGGALELGPGEGPGATFVIILPAVD